jgi:dUTP pyrophosphatase
MSSESAAVLRFVKLTENALTPMMESPKAAGFDLRSAYGNMISATRKELIKIDLQIKLPSGYYGELHLDQY